MSQQELLTYVVRALDSAGIEYMVTGSIVSSLQGEPRLTHDIDFVVAIERDQIPRVLESFPGPRFYIDPPAVREAVETAGMFNVVDAEEGGKVDFWLIRDDPFDRSRFERKYVEEMFGARVNVSRPEDTILAKLWWSRLSGGSEKPLQDAVSVFEIQANALDRRYLESWAERLDVGDLLVRVEREASVDEG
ncbi:MAG TPA: hypothetical protein VFM44_07315 [Gemmatimonadota bacterium]|nr:hypothetical protein [Gemmatimonadota bacterium]